MENQVEQTTNVDNTVATDTTIDAASSLNNNPYINSAANQNINLATPAAAPSTNPLASITSNFDTNKFLIGLAIGAAGAYLLTNENAQKAMFKTFAKGSELFTAGIEEMKERFEDAKAEMEAKA
eukprot:Anaeramoba_flamelloidesa325723_423.p5 GENE.a325723_423~~a325723_423.p5  ORF type:complete len:124 (-),score=10.96 a325723_423:3023-3394(-)